MCITLMPVVVIVAEMWVDCSNPHDKNPDIHIPMAVPAEEVKEVSNQSDELKADCSDDGVARTATQLKPLEIEGREVTISGQVALGNEEDGGHQAAGHPVVQKQKKQKPIRHYINFIEAGVTVKDRPVPVMSILIVVGLIAYGIVGTVYGFRLEPPRESEAWYPTQHMFSLFWNSVGNDYLGADKNQYEDISLTFGIKGIDRSGFDEYKPGKNRGKPVYDDDWNLAAPSCQKVVVKMCQDVVKYTCDSSACKPTNLIARGNTTECFMADFRSWAQSSYYEDTYTMDEATFYSRLEEFRQTEFQKFHDQVTWQDEIGFIDGELKFATVYFTSTMKQDVSSSEKLEVANRLDDFLSRVKRYPECDECNCKSLMYTSPFAFVWMRSEQGLVKGFYQGLAIAFPVALIVLLFATGNIFISTYAIITVFFIVFGVLGFAKYALGWNLGISESIAGIIIIGFSVDYTVHLGHMFNEAELNGIHSRKEKFEFASEKIVGTIVGGAVTTAGAGVFMFACQLRFFFKMAALIVCTIVLSYVYSLGFFMALLYLIGPEKDDGNIVVYFHRAVAAMGLGSPPQPVSSTQKVTPRRMEYKQEAGNEPSDVVA